MSPRLRRLAGSAIPAVVGLLLLAAGLAREHVRCVRDAGPASAAEPAGVCTIRAGLPLFERTAELPLAAIAEHRFDVRQSRGGLRGATILLDRAGRELRLGAGDEAAARGRYDALHAFFTGQRADVDLTTGPTWWLVVAGALAFALAGWWAVHGPPDTTRDSAHVAEHRTPGLRAPVIALIVGALALLGLASSIFFARTRGTLQLVCHQRCDAGGGTCMPGGEVFLTLPPGEHEVRVYNPDAPATPIVHRVLVVRGQVTRFECAL
ncbi:MAG TPA: hypothetical protein VIK91_11200 [Nannocystis sp.]